MNNNYITTERVDDVPLLLAQMERMDLAATIDTHAHPHGNRQGLSFGWLVVLWLTHILLQADHRMNSGARVGHDPRHDPHHPAAPSLARDGCHR